MDTVITVIYAEAVMAPAELLTDTAAAADTLIAVTYAVVMPPLIMAVRYTDPGMATATRYPHLTTGPFIGPTTVTVGGSLVT